MNTSTSTPTGTINTGAPVFQWDHVPDVTWYNVWIGTAGSGSPPWQQYFYDWMLAENLGCENTGLCTLQSGVDVAFGEVYNLTLPAGEYIWSIQSWGPGGFSINGDFAASLQSWVESDALIVP